MFALFRRITFTMGINSPRQRTKQRYNVLSFYVPIIWKQAHNIPTSQTDTSRQISVADFKVQNNVIYDDNMETSESQC